MGRRKKEDLLALPEKEDNILLENRFDKEKLKLELKDYIDDKINEKFIDDKINEKFIKELDRVNEKLLKEKSRRLIFKNIFIIFLLGIIGFLLYFSFDNGLFDKYFNTNKIIVDDEKKEEKIDKVEPTPSTVPTPTATIAPTPTPKVPTLDELKEEYGGLLDNYYVTETSGYLLDFYSADLSTNLKKYITLNSLNFDTLKKEEDYQIITASTFKIAYEKLFNDTYTNSTFDYGDNKIRYVEMMDAYMTSEILKKDENTIEREIVDIKVNNNEVIITTIEGIIKEDKLYEIINNTEIEGYKGDSLINYQDKLNKLIYVFKDGKLIKLEK